MTQDKQETITSIKIEKLLSIVRDVLYLRVGMSSDELLRAMTEIRRKLQPREPHFIERPSSDKTRVCLRCGHGEGEDDGGCSSWGKSWKRHFYPKTILVQHQDKHPTLSSGVPTKTIDMVFDDKIRQLREYDIFNLNKWQTIEMVENLRGAIHELSIQPKKPVTQDKKDQSTADKLEGWEKEMLEHGKKASDLIEKFSLFRYCHHCGVYPEEQAKWVVNKVREALAHQREEIGKEIGKLREKDKGWTGHPTIPDRFGEYEKIQSAKGFGYDSALDDVLAKLAIQPKGKRVIRWEGTIGGDPNNPFPLSVKLKKK